MGRDIWMSLWLDETLGIIFLTNVSEMVQSADVSIESIFLFTDSDED